MYDQSFTMKSLSKVIWKSDFLKHPELKDEEQKEEYLAQAISDLNTNDFNTFSIGVNTIKNKPVYKVKRYSDTLLLRKASKNIKVITKVKQQDRDAIIYNLTRFLSEGVKYRIYKLDIKSFYESINTNNLIDKLADDSIINKHTVSIIKILLEAVKVNNLEGIPRGLSLSAVLSEYVMRKFDQEIKIDSEVFYYSRYVDDIIIITSSNEDKEKFFEFLTSKLPEGLNFNEKKNKVITVPAINNKENQLAEFNYLGYQLTVKDPQKEHKKGIKHQFRDVIIDIAPNKVKKIKTRLIRSVLSFSNNQDLSLFYDRIKLLTGNYSIRDRNKGIKRKTGIYYNYKHVNSPNMLAISSLDSFLRNILTSKTKSKFTKMLPNILDIKSKRRLLKFTFKNGFENRVFLHFKPLRLKKITQCWKYD
jgi:hypothetical protein